MITKEKQAEIWAENLKKGYRFFQPHNASQPTPRTEREAFLQKSKGRELTKTI